MIKYKLERIKEIIKEELLREAIEDYIKAFREFDWAYTMTDDPQVYKNGQEQESKIHDIYNSLSGGEQRQAAIWYREYFDEINMWSNTEISRRVTRWEPETDFNPDKFDGTMFRG